MLLGKKFRLRLKIKYDSYLFGSSRVLVEPAKPGASPKYKLLIHNRVWPAPSQLGRLKYILRGQFHKNPRRTKKVKITIGRSVIIGAIATFTPDLTSYRRWCINQPHEMLTNHTVTSW